MGDAGKLEAELALESVAARLLGRRRGVRIGRYQLLERLGKGGCGVVFAAHDPSLDRAVAIKQIRPSSSGGALLQTRLLREAQALAQLRHPNVVEIFDVIEDDRTPPSVCLVMERLRGRTLRSWVASARPGWRDILRAYLDASLALDAAHRAELVHRDFKPDNAMIDDAGNVTVLDFGLAFATGASTDDVTEPAAGQGDAASGSLTSTGLVAGTLRYMAPEQHARGTVSPATDVFSWCASLFEALYGHPAFEGSSAAALTLAKDDEHVQQPGSSEIPAHVGRALRAGLRADPRRRPGLAELRRMLDRRSAEDSSRPRTWMTAALAAVPLLFLGAAASSPAASGAPTAAAAPLAIERTPAEEAELAQLHARAGQRFGDVANVDREATEDFIAAALRRAETLEDPGLASKLLQHRAKLLLLHGDLEGASAAAQDAVWTALGSGDRERAIAAMPILIDLVGHRRGDEASGSKIATRAREWIAELGNPPHLVALHGTVVSRRLIGTGDLDAARAHLRAALATFESMPPPAYGHVQCLFGYVALELEHGDLDRAAAHQQRAIEVLDAAGDPTDSNYAVALQLGGEIAHVDDRPEDAAALYAQAVERLRARFGPDHPALAWPTAFLGVLEHRAGRSEEGFALIDRGYAIAKERGAPPALLADIEHNREQLQREESSTRAARRSRR